MQSTQWTPRNQQQEKQTQQSNAPALDPKIHQQYMSFLHHATAAQFKPIKLYVLFNDPTSVSCIQMVRENSDLDRQVEVVDAAPTGNRPKWLKGVPSLMDEKGQFYLGKGIFGVRFPLPKGPPCWACRPVFTGG